MQMECRTQYVGHKRNATNPRSCMFNERKDNVATAARGIAGREPHRNGVYRVGSQYYIN